LYSRIDNTPQISNDSELVVFWKSQLQNRQSVADENLKK